MTPETFVAALDSWRGNGRGRIPSDHRITTADEARAVCRALASGPVYDTPEAAGSLPLHELTAFFQTVDSKEAATVLRQEGLPHLRRFLETAVQELLPADPDDSPAQQRHNTHLFVLKILAMYRQPGDGPLLVQAARNPRMAGGYLWSIVFGIVGDRHPDAAAVCEALGEPPPEGFVGVAYLDFANAMAVGRKIARHPFDSEAGIARLVGYLEDRNPKNYSYAVSATASIPFLDAAARDTLMTSADQHPDALVRLEAAWALAKTGSEFGRQRLAQLCLKPRFAARAIEYLEELGLGAHIPAKARDPDYQAMAEMCKWLMHPMEFGAAPDEISQYDTRMLNWPPTNDRRRLWLFRYRYEPRDGADANEGIGLVGSVTFALFGEATVALSPEDVYALHCCWELQTNGDPRAPEQRAAAAGRKMLAEANPGFGTA